MKIILDAMGGDNAPAEIVRGAAMAVEKLDADLILVGDADAIRTCISDCKGEQYLEPDENGQSRIRIVPTKEVLTMEDDPFDVVRKKKNSSMAIALRLLADGEGDALVCAGNTGALFTGATMIVRPTKGIRRAAIATILPFERPVLLLDSGANVNVTAEYMEQFALMGSVYMQKLFGIASPAVGLVNNGTEPHKGTSVYVETYELLKKNKDIRFVGNIEGKDIPKGTCDVLVADGFTGNIVLKLVEGMGYFFMRRMKKMFFRNPATKISAVLLKGELQQLKNDFDVSEYGGSPFLGISKPVIKSHGSSDAREIMNACRQAINYVNTGVSEDIAACAGLYLQKKAETAGDKTE